MASKKKRFFRDRDDFVAYLASRAERSLPLVHRASAYPGITEECTLHSSRAGKDLRLRFTWSCHGLDWMGDLGGSHAYVLADADALLEDLERRFGLHVGELAARSGEPRGPLPSVEDPPDDLARYREAFRQFEVDFAAGALVDPTLERVVEPGEEWARREAVGASPASADADLEDVEGPVSSVVAPSVVPRRASVPPSLPPPRHLSYSPPMSAAEPSLRPDALDPRAPSQADWDAMSEADRQRACALLPAKLPYELSPCEGDTHRKPRESAVSTLEAFFRRVGRRVYVSSELAVYYPGEPRFCPDVLVVLDDDGQERTRWIVPREGKGLDLVLEVHVAGDEAKDLSGDVERYARLGIREYFVFDRTRLAVRGYRLAPAEGGAAPRSYQRIVPNAGGYASEVLGLELRVDGTRLRFEVGGADVPEGEELAAKLRTMVDKLEARHLEAEALAEEMSARAEAEATRADSLATRLAAALAEITRLQHGG